MQFKCELNNIDYSDKMLLSALENISEDITYKFELNNEEMLNMLSIYLKEKLDIDLTLSEMTINYTTYEVEGNNTDELKAVIKQINEHFGSSAIVKDFFSYTMNPIVLMRKLFKFASCTKKEETFAVEYNTVHDFKDSWAFDYIINNEREE